MKLKLLIFSLLIVVFSITGCKKEPKSIYGKAHVQLKKIVNIASELTNKQEVNNRFEEMKKAIILFHKTLIKMGNKSMEELEIISKKYTEETKSFTLYLNSILSNRQNGFIQDMRRIGKLNLNGQRLRNSFYEAIYIFRKKVIKKLNQSNNAPQPPS